MVKITCPVCSDEYPQNIIDQFKDYKEQKEKEKQEALNKELEKETLKKMEEAVDILFDEYKENDVSEKNLNIMFLLGKANFLKGRYDLTITFLFKLVKIQFDFPDAFLYLGKAYEKLNLHDKAKWAFDRAK